MFSSPAPRDRTVPISRNCCWKRITKFTDWFTASTDPGRPNLEHLIRDGRICQKRRHLYPADLDDADSVRGPLEQAAPDEIYHLAGQSHVGQSFEKVEETCRVTAFGTLRLLELVRWLTRPPRFFHGQFQ